jgi:hypothetical protein
VHELSGYEEYQLICSTLTQVPAQRQAAPPAERDRFWRVVVAVVAIPVVALLMVGLLRPDPHVRIVEQQRADVAQVEGELRDLQTLRATLGEGDVTRWDMENLAYRIGAAEQKLAAERAELAEAEQQLEEGS